MDDKKKKSKELNVIEIKDQKFFRPIIAAYALKNNLCQAPELENYLNNELSKFPGNVELLRSLFESLNDEELAQFTLPKSEKGDSVRSKESNSKLDLNAMTRQFSSSSSGKKK